MQPEWAISRYRSIETMRETMTSSGSTWPHKRENVHSRRHGLIGDLSNGCKSFVHFWNGSKIRLIRQREGESDRTSALFARTNASCRGVSPRYGISSGDQARVSCETDALQFPFTWLRIFAPTLPRIQSLPRLCANGKMLAIRAASSPVSCVPLCISKMSDVTLRLISA